MAYNGWLSYYGQEFVNISRTVQLAEALGIEAVWVEPETVAWIETSLSGADYDDITEAPWYDPGYPASAEFAGIMPLSFAGLDDSTLEATTTEYITSGGKSGAPRNATLPIVASVIIMASTARGAEYGLRWMNRLLRGTGGSTFCLGGDLHYFRYEGADAPVAHRRDVRLTRGSSVTRKRLTDCSCMWWVTFTLTAGDPFEYGEAVEVLSGLGGAPVGATSSGAVTLVEEGCPVYDYSPIYDPLYPALVPSPTAPDLLPDGWDIEDGMTFYRYWARVDTPEPNTLSMVPLLTLSTDTEARRVRVSIWPADSEPDDLCGPLFSVVNSYLPSGGINLYIDGEQQATYVWDGFSEAVRRADSLTYSPDAKPVRWSEVSDSDELLITLDLFVEDDSSGMEGEGDVRLAVSLIPKSD